METFEDGQLGVLTRPIRGYRAIDCYSQKIYRESKQKNWIRAISTLRVDTGSTVLMIKGPNNSNLFNTSQVYVENIEDFRGNPISDDFECQSSAMAYPIKNFYNKDKKQLDIGIDFFEDWTFDVQVTFYYKHIYKKNQFIKSPLTKTNNYSIMNLDGFYLFLDKSQAMTSDI
ncbi:hypothetical protein [Acanthamoeba castellanii mimivirus]|uniref:Uncharacterized protein L87 n=5 Tax=Mimivirus TaxID=315393 RepID=YL087_MIMIV|nr:hypothetical protein MIMI_gp0105 [Acanthamoeba polyphaga mimivirus]Q5UPF9.1 RecName: Full=Uncharacterized protein L87 [Acanthamoeba polyphaga mimivirus]AEQ60268.1 hypothetical protein [Acanthamoeba castellanii mamavirus]AHA45788.1 hypothetical protein HIRU_S882 [Hirudovirus strain Sangsue]ALR83600.1 hypothetical protein [Niemeyer virus]AMK61756.1 hypothetical protein [Samba virus]AMZ02537.1 hypothetical protein [Mimivirus Bombay]EJN41167.1 hypothetical protein lvs_L56 [Acanthamoeba polyph